MRRVLCIVGLFVVGRVVAQDRDSGVDFWSGVPEDPRGRLVFRVSDKYEVWVKEAVVKAYSMRKYTYMVDRNEAGYDIVYLCWGEKTANSRMEDSIKELAATGLDIEVRRFNVMGMRLLSVRDTAYIDEALFMKYKRGSSDVWRVSLSYTLLVYQKDLAMFRDQYEYY